MMGALTLAAVLGTLAWAVLRVLRSWRSPGGWLGLAVTAAVSTFAMYVYGLFSAAAYDIGETCGQLGQRYDNDYRSERWREPGLWFPLHNRCNAGNDLVPAYVNPLLVTLAAITLSSVAAAVTLTITVRNAKRSRAARR